MSHSKSQLSFLIILSTLMAFTSLSTDIYLPAMPTMQQELGNRVELTVTGFLIGFALAQLVWGPISDRIGRKIPLYVGLFLFLIGSLGCALAPTMAWVVFWRVFQAVGACVGPMISRAMIRDLYDSRAAAHMLSTLMIIMALAPIVGPFIGGFLLNAGTWRLIFILMAGISIVMLLAMSLLKESLPAEKRSKEGLGHSFQNYSKLLTSKNFMGYTLCVTFFYLAAYAFITGSSEAYISYFHIPANHYGVFFGINIIGISLVSFLNRSLVNHFPLTFLLRLATSLTSIFALLLLLLNLSPSTNIWTVALPMLFIFSMNGIIAACSNAAALNSVDPSMTGSAAALLGSLQYGSGIISSLLLALFSDGSPKTMVWIIFLAVLASCAMAWLVKEK